MGDKKAALYYIGIISVFSSFSCFVRAAPLPLFATPRLAG